MSNWMARGPSPTLGGGSSSKSLPPALSRARPEVASPRSYVPSLSAVSLVDKRADHGSRDFRASGFRWCCRPLKSACWKEASVRSMLPMGLPPGQPLPAKTDICMRPLPLRAQKSSGDSGGRVGAVSQPSSKRTGPSTRPRRASVTLRFVGFIATWGLPPPCSVSRSAFAPTTARLLEGGSGRRPLSFFRRTTDSAAARRSSARCSSEFSEARGGSSSTDLASKSPSRSITPRTAPARARNASSGTLPSWTSCNSFRP
mmetsp:Transcript_95695/g.308924  ORF Transcript_95695/g.308924 Transcript_95695/m.308924 type:complete len:258 (+) Transcript_95695:99-872(+)